MSDEPRVKPVPRQSSLWRTAKTVAWSFLGVRKNSAFQEDGARLNPFHLIGVGIVAVLIFVVGLMVLVNWVVAK